MNGLKHKKILLAITGSIAAYKSAELIRLLRGKQADVKVVMTKDAGEFITELTLQALSGQPVYQGLLDSTSEASMSHINLAKWADLLLVAPATANLMAKFVGGIADDLLTTLYLATPAPVAIVPAMNQQMWRHPATCGNKDKLKARGHLIWGPAAGEQACGDVGLGRMLEPTEIVGLVESLFMPKVLTGTKILITAGPTREPIDPVRYISNHSSGKMGYALAQAAADLGAEVLLISGPTELPTPLYVKKVAVETAQEMHSIVMTRIKDCDIFISSAAVADFRCAQIGRRKIKKSDTLHLDLIKNEDILMAVSMLRNPPFLVGFAAETDNLIVHARDKLTRKNLDMIIANSIGVENAGFNSDFNTVSVLTANDQIDFPLTTKLQLARDILPLIVCQYKKKTELM